MEFTGDNLPTGKYVGFKFYDASRSQAAGYFYVYDLFVSGEPIKNLEIAPSETVYANTETYENKLAYLKASVNHNYQATLQLADLTKDTLSEKIADETNMISGGEYQTFSSKDTNNWTTLTADDITKITDKGYIGTSAKDTCFGGNTFLANSGYNKNTCGDSEEMKGANRVANNKYDLMMTLELEKKISIDKLYIVGHPNPALGTFLYTVYVSNSKENLYSYENEVFHYDFSTKASGSERWKFNGSSGSANRTGEIQYLEFKGDKLPTGKYIGIKFYDTSDHETLHGAFNLYEVGVFGYNITYLDKAVENDVPADETVTFAEKLALLDAISQYAGTELRMTAMTKDYVNNLLVETVAQNLIKSAKIKYYTDNDFADVASAIITNVTKGDIAYGNGTTIVNTGTNSSIGSQGRTDLFYDGELHGQDRVDSDVDVYDALISLDLGETTEINDFYMFNHLNTDTSVVTYKLYVSDSQSDLFENGNEVAYWNYYKGYSKNDKKYLLNSGNVTGNPETRRSEAQHWKFTQEKPVGRYVGVKVYEASRRDNNDFLAIYEIGVLGDQKVVPAPKQYNISFNHGEAVKVDVEQTEIVEGGSATFEILKAEDVEVTSVTAGGEEIVSNDGVYTITNVTSDLEVKITTNADDRFPDSEGVFNGIDLTKNSSFYGKALWDADTVYGETATVYEGRGPISFAYPIDKVISVRSYDLQKNYVYGVDYTIVDGKLVLTDDSSIPVCDQSVLNLLNEEENDVDYGKVATWKNELYKYQISVTYTKSETWGNGALYETKPQGKLSQLSNVYDKLKNGEDITVVFYGDSTTLGCDASGLNEQSLAYNSGNDASTLEQKQYTTYGIFGETSMPDWACDTWAVQVVNALAETYDVNVNIINKAVGSSTSAWGSKQENMETLLDGIEPDLMVIAYGGNDRNNSSETMNTNISKIIDYVRTRTSDCDIVVNSTFKRPYTELTGKLATHEEGYYLLEENYNDLVVVPVYSYTNSVMDSVKQPIDYLSNGYNHMNDFGQRLYASVVSASLTVSDYTVTFKVDGEVVKTQTVEYGSPATAPAVADKYGYTFSGWDVDFTKVTEDLEVNGAYTEKAGNCTITFESITGNVLGTVIVENGNVPADVDAVKAEIDAFTASVKNVYGYTFIGWDNEVYDNKITTSMQVRPTYIADETVRTFVNVYEVDEETKYIDNRHLRFDSQIYLQSTQGADYWADAEGNVLIGEPTGYLYACGTEMNIYAKKGAFTTPKVVIVGKNHKAEAETGNGFTVFAHVNVENAIKFGVVFSSNTGHTENPNFDVYDADADVDGKRYVKVEIDASKLDGQIDFMGTLNYKAGANPTRWARAYVVVDNGNGEEIYYTTAIRNK